MKTNLYLASLFMLMACSALQRLPSSQGPEMEAVTEANLPEEKWRTTLEKMSISNLENFKSEDGQIVREFEMDNFGSKKYSLDINNSTEIQELHATIKCDRAFWYHQEKKSEHALVIYYKKKFRPSVTVNLDPESLSCELRFKNPQQPSEVYGVKLISARGKSKLARFHAYVDDCHLPDAKGLSGTEQLFLTPKYDSMTCPQTIGAIKTHEDAIEGLTARAELLLGRPLPPEMLEQSDPTMELDFSKAPKLEAILVSYLVFRNDFYGSLMARLLKYHADQGAQVRIIVAKVIELAKDKKMLNQLQESSNNIKLREFRYESQSPNLLKHVSEFHRSQHIKLFITLSAEEKNNVVFIGGRNIHDGFIFKELPDVGKHPELVQYGKKKDGKDENFTHWRDFEMSIRSRNFAERVAAHYMTFWEIDSKNFKLRSINKNTVSKNAPDANFFDVRGEKKLIRHMMSIPFSDDHALEKFYVEMFDSALKEIKLSTPYFRPTKNIGKAMERAVARGVAITLITRLDLQGDTASFILGDVNKTGVNKFLNKIKIYEYTEPKVILHSKIVLIDGKFSFIGSVNMNKRSFIHDTENSVLLYDPEFHDHMVSILETYYTTSREITEKQKVKFWKKVVIRMLDKVF